MGLDIRAYSKLIKTTPYDEDGDMGLNFHINPYFDNRADNILENYNYEHNEDYSFRVGSYSGYNSWRCQLCVLLGYKNYEDFWTNAEDTSPFYPLINFSDCEGTLGCAVSAQLYIDFCNYTVKAEETKDEYFINIYNEFKKAFEVASHDGAVAFL